VFYDDECLRCIHSYITLYFFLVRIFGGGLSIGPIYITSFTSHIYDAALIFSVLDGFDGPRWVTTAICVNLHYSHSPIVNNIMPHRQPKSPFNKHNTHELGNFATTERYLFFNDRKTLFAVIVANLALLLISPIRLFLIFKGGPWLSVAF
jgi:hypothetical protein